MSNRVDPAAEAPLIAQGLYSYRIGGSERVGAQLCIEYAARGYRVVCFAYHGSEGPFRDLLESHGVECVDLNYLHRPRLVRRITYQMEMYRFFRARGIRAIQVHHAVALSLCGIAARYAGIKHVVMSEHAIFQFQEQPAYKQRSIKDCRYASAITGVHPGIIDYFRDELHVPSDRLHVITNGVTASARDHAARRTARLAMNIGDSTFVVLYVGRLEAVKDLGTLLNAVATISDPVRRSMRLVLVGDGSERASLESQCRSLQLGATVTFAGARSDVAGLLNMADAFVMTSRTEGLPMALIEAMAAGLPCVATAVGGIPAVLSDEAGLVVPPNDPAAVAQALQRLAIDEPLRRQLAQRALARVQAQYALEPVVTSYLKLLGLPPRWSTEH